MARKRTETLTLRVLSAVGLDGLTECCGAGVDVEDGDVTDRDDVFGWCRACWAAVTF